MSDDDRLAVLDDYVRALRRKERAAAEYKEADEDVDRCLSAMNRMAKDAGPTPRR